MNMRKILLGSLLATAGIGGIAACSSGANRSDHQTAGTHAPVVPPSAAQPAKPVPPSAVQPAKPVPPSAVQPAKPVPPSAAQPAKPAPQYTAAQENAIGSANDYLAMSGFSRAGLIKQLSSSYGDGYTEADATFAVDHLTVDWNQQAVRSAKSYLSMTHFSRAGLVEQLSSPYGDGYTVAQATYAANNVGL
jgi:Host cell surface-exposed lipoprotein